MTQMMRPQARERALADGFAIASLVLSIVWLGGLGSLLALVFGHTSRFRAKDAGLKPSLMAEWGTWLGSIGLAAAVVTYIFIGVAIAHSGQPPACDPSNPNWPNC